MSNNGQAKGCGDGVCGTGTPAMSQEDIAHQMIFLNLKEWTLLALAPGEEPNSIRRTFEFRSRKDAIERKALIESLEDGNEHHAHISGCYATWTFTLTTHSAGNKLTEKDFFLAAAINLLVANHLATPKDD